MKISEAVTGANVQEKLQQYFNNRFATNLNSEKKGAVADKHLMLF